MLLYTCNGHHASQLTLDGNVPDQMLELTKMCDVILWLYQHHLTLCMRVIDRHINFDFDYTG